MENKKAIYEFLGEKEEKEEYGEKELCDAQTGECYTIREKDGIIERIDKKFITEDGRQLLRD